MCSGGCINCSDRWRPNKIGVLVEGREALTVLKGSICRSDCQLSQNCPALATVDFCRPVLERLSNLTLTRLVSVAVICKLVESF